MTKTPSDGKSGLSPHLVVDGAAKAIDFYRQAFGATELTRIEGPDGRIIHAAVSIDGATVMLVDENKEWGMLGPKALKGTPVTLHLGSPDADAAIKRAEDAGAKVVMPAEDAFWGDRYGMVEDPFGHRWSIATPQRTMTVEEIRAAAKKAMPDYAKGNA